MHTVLANLAHRWLFSKNRFWKIFREASFGEFLPQRTQSNEEVAEGSLSSDTVTNHESTKDGKHENG
jgi:hypothetical protein